MNASQTQKDHFQNFYLKPSESRYVDDLTDYFEQERASGKTLYFMSLTYNDPKDFPLTAEKACRYFKKFHKRLLHHLFGSRYNYPKYREIEPSVLAFLDVSSSKKKEIKLLKVPKYDSSFHHHCVLVADASTTDQLDCLLDKVSREAFKETLSSRLQLRSIDFQKIKPTRSDTRFVVDYCSGYARKYQSDDLMLQVYPIAKSEFRSAP